MKNPKLPKIDVIFDFRNQSSADRPGTVHIRVYHNRHRTYASTGVRVLPSEWSDQYGVVNRPDALALNRQINNALEHAKKVLQNSLDTHAGTPSTAQIKLSNSPAPFLDWLLNEIKKAPIAESTRNMHLCLYRALLAYNRLKNFSDLTPSKITAFLDYLKSAHRPRRASDRVMTNRTLRNTYGYFARYVRLAQKQHLASLDALLGVSIAPGRSKPREHLTEDELNRWLNLKPKNPRLTHARDIYIIQCGTGLAYADILQTDFSQLQKFGSQYAITGHRHKTDVPFFAVLLDFAVPVALSLRGQPQMPSNYTYNNRLRKLARLAGINKTITSHTGRHTYACLCLSRGVRIEAVQRALGHNLLATTQIYAKLVNQDVLNAFAAANTNQPKAPREKPSD